VDEVAKILHETQQGRSVGTDYFIKDLVAIWSEVRGALAVYRPQAFGLVTGLTADTALTGRRDEARDLLATFDLRAVPAQKIRAALAALERQIRPAEAARLRTAWLELHGGEPTIH
jgi:hypothetical protein